MYVIVRSCIFQNILRKNEVNYLCYFNFHMFFSLSFLNLLLHPLNQFYQLFLQLLSQLSLLCLFILIILNDVFYFFQFLHNKFNPLINILPWFFQWLRHLIIIRFIKFLPKWIQSVYKLSHPTQGDRIPSSLVHSHSAIRGAIAFHSLPFAIPFASSGIPSSILQAFVKYPILIQPLIINK